jgi:hypothetical protein
MFFFASEFDEKSMSAAILKIYVSVILHADPDNSRVVHIDAYMLEKNGVCCKYRLISRL